MKFKITGTQTLKGCKVGFFYPGDRRVFVCPSVASLARTDLVLIKDLKVFRMRYNPDGSPKFDSLEDWVVDVISRHVIFSSSEEIDD